MNKTIENQIISLHTEGWKVENIASLAKVKPARVKAILREKNLLM